MSQKYRRKKSNYDSARAAWRDIDRRTKWEPCHVLRTEHTRTHYVWVLPDG